MPATLLTSYSPIRHCTTLGWSRDDIALSYMDFIVRRVRPIVTHHGWEVGVMKEFYPRGASLLGLNVNKGSEVCIRFRVPGNKEQFLPFHEVLCTALHELAHCEVSRHDKRFWSLYYGLVRECEKLEVDLVLRGEQLYPSHVSIADTATAVVSPRSRPRRAVSSRTTRARGIRRQNTDHELQPPITGILTERPLSPSASSRSSSRDLTNRIAPTPFEGEGRRLGGASVVPRITSPNLLRSHVANAAQQRLELLRLANTSSSATHAEQLCERLPDVVSGSSYEGEGNWCCPRCSFRNSPAWKVCEMCSDVNDESDGADVVDGSPVSWNCSQCTFQNVLHPHHCEMCGRPRKRLRVEVSYRITDLPAGSMTGGSCDMPIEISDGD